MTRVKICGATWEADVRAAADAGADAVGFVVDVPVDTHREVSPDRAADLAAAVPPFVASVAVTMPETPADAIALAERVEPDVLQVHGGLDDGDLASLSPEVDARIFRGVDAAATADARRFDDVADALVVDSTDADGGGGTGRTHDWAATRDLAASVASPVLLAGGLTPDNVAEAVRTVEPYGVDVATGVEAPDGTKDHDAVARFVAAAKRACATVQP